MSVSKYIFGENIPLLHLEKFSQDYTLEVKNDFMMGNENPPIILSTLSDITVEQDNDDKFISNNIHLKNITGSTDNEVMKPFLEQSLALAEISPTISIKRSKKGEILKIEQREKLYSDWELWKSDKLKSVFTEEKEQQKFIRNYENGLVNFEQNFKKNLQYLLLLPEIYSLIFPPNKHFVFLCSETQLSSRLVEGMEYHYQMKLVKLDEDKDFLSLEFNAILNNRNDIGKKYLNKIYNNHQEFSINDFNFKIENRYLIEKSTSRIISANLNFNEKLHSHLNYSIYMNLEKKNILSESYSV